MTIHYQNYKRFSAGQGFAGVLCRGLGAFVDSKRWVAVDCQACRIKIIDVEVISRDGERGTIEGVGPLGVELSIIGDNGLSTWRRVAWADLDKDWAPLSVLLKSVFS